MKSDMGKQDWAGTPRYPEDVARQVKLMAEQTLDNPKKCVLCTIKWCVMGDLCRDNPEYRFGLAAASPPKKGL